ncbi:hypothetical protein JY651_23780 [Pyxidicoccus parkwayensis]|jgi:hypothetical protein|uniref:Uncharacterized protein n=1 Tax=Pyxidicoccus parkwayensis TaxID=2813578 RepID=A0ABX7PBA6_9BACT|nr:hypothetical protein [Pyxidicoccus parkwaysis]QSQ27737.1 hypothetical protein JY651_23780 [Pyxidicoccus parkwaysis]
MRLPVMLHFAWVLTVGFLLLHLAGGRDCVGVLSGTREGGVASLALGLAYTLSWFSVVLLAPPLLLAGLARLALQRRASRQQALFSSV